MRAEEVELDGQDGRVIRRGELHELRAKAGTVERMDAHGVLPMARDDGHVQVAAAGEPEDGLAQRVVHQCVEPVAAQPVGRHAPDLADEVGVRADGPAAGPELLPEGLVVDLARHVEPPAVDPEPEPVLGHPEQILTNLRLVGIELGQGRQAPPRRVPEGGRRRPGRRVGDQRLARVEPLVVEVEPMSIG